MATVNDDTPEPGGKVKAQVRQSSCALRLPPLPCASYVFGEPRKANVKVRDNDGDAVVPASTATESREPALSVSDTRVKEGRGAALVFTVSLDEAPGRQVRVRYATRDGTALQGEDYRATSGTLLFGPSDTEKTVMVEVLDDAHDEGAEWLQLVLSGPDGARIADGVALGTIENEDPMPAVWLARLGRTVAEQTLGASRVAWGRRARQASGAPLRARHSRQPPLAIPRAAA